MTQFFLSNIFVVSGSAAGLFFGVLKYKPFKLKYEIRSTCEALAKHLFFSNVSYRFPNLPTPPVPTGVSYTLCMYVIYILSLSCRDYLIIRIFSTIYI